MIKAVLLKLLSTDTQTFDRHIPRKTTSENYVTGTLFVMLYATPQG